MTDPSGHDLIELTAEGISLRFAPRFGIIRSITVQDGGQSIAPLHTAPWVGTSEALPQDAAPHHAELGGDFFCAPFGAEEDGAPLHGWPANSAWDARSTTSEMTARLRKTVQGAVVTKILRLRDEHPFVYQAHRFDGGAGQVAVANHANVSVRGGAIIRTSKKRFWQTPVTAPEDDPARGRSALSYPAQGQATAFPCADGPVDLTAYPWGPRHEDFVIGVEAAGHALGWTAVTRPDQEDLFLSLRNPRALPMTMLWHSNGGRDYAPWSGRHFGCLGVEDGAAAHLLPSPDQDTLTGPGALDLGGQTEVRHVTGSIHWPSKEPIAQITMNPHGVKITGERGAVREVPLDTSFLGVAA